MTTDDDFITGDEGAEEEEENNQGGGEGFGDEQTLVTREGLRKLKEELDHLKNVRRKEVAQRLKEAISYGDLSENSEYEEAKNEQAFVEGRIIEIERKMKNVKIITEKKSEKRGGKEVGIGSTVTFRNKTKGTDPETFTIVGATEADPFDFKISNESPIGKSLLSRQKGDTFGVETPSGTVRYEVTRVE